MGGNENMGSIFFPSKQQARGWKIVPWRLI